MNHLTFNLMWLEVNYNIYCRKESEGKVKSLCFLSDGDESALLSPDRTRTLTHLPLYLPWNILPFQVRHQPECSRRRSHESTGVTSSFSSAGVWAARGSLFTRTSSSRLFSTLWSPSFGWRPWRTTTSCCRGTPYVYVHIYHQVQCASFTFPCRSPHKPGKAASPDIYIQCFSSSDELQSVSLHSSLHVWLQLLLDAVWGNLPAHAHRGGCVRWEATPDVVLPSRLGFVAD